MRGSRERSEQAERPEGKTRGGFLAFAGILAVFAALLFLFFCCDQRLLVRRYAETTEKVSERVRLALLTDLHSTIYGENQEELLEALAGQEPDVVLLAGDIADDQKSHEGTRLLLEAIGKAYPCYYVSGNHEFWSGEIGAIKEMIRSYGVTILEGESLCLQVNGQEIGLGGVDDPDGFEGRGYQGPGAPPGWENQLAACEEALDASRYEILLSHRPELTEYYTGSGFDLVLAGHAHGGQVRIPGILNGLLAPDQGLFPKYAGGRYQLGDTVMIVSRGLCKNRIPRVFNRPELVIVDLEPTAVSR